MLLSFLDFELNEELCELRRGGAPIAIQPKAFRMLRHLAANADRVVTKNELLDTLWPGEPVSETSLTFCINAARRALGDSGADQRFIKAMRGHGYRFVVPVSRSEAIGSGAQADLAAADAPASRSMPRPPATLVGRAEELRILDEMTERLEKGQFSVVLLEGEAGIGKTALLRECAWRAAARGIRVLGGQSVELDSELPFWMWATAMRHYVESQQAGDLRSVLGAGAADVAKLVPSLLHKLPELEAPADLDPDQARLRLFSSVLGFLTSVSRREPLLVCIDDLHWADRSSLLLLQYLARELSDERVMILGTQRPLATDPNETLAGVVADLRRQSNAKFLSLSGLDRSDVTLLLRELLGPDGATENVVDVVLARSQGNPFFVEQLCRHFADGTAQAPARWEDTGAGSLPPGIRELIGRRLQRFDENGLRVLTTAAVLGRQFSATLLQQVLSPPVTEDDVFHILDEALHCHLLRDMPSSPDRYEFCHALVQETLYAGLLGARRVRLHERVARALEDSGAEAADTAQHYLAALPHGDQDKAVQWAMAAAQDASRRLAYEEAARWYERLLEHSALTLVPAQRCELLLCIGTMRSDSGQRAPSLLAFEQAAVLARELGDAASLARAALGIVYRRPLLRDFTFDILEEALATLPASERGLRAKLLARWAMWARQNPDGRPLCEQRAGEALALLRDDIDARNRGEVYVDLIAAIWYPDRAAQRRELIDELLTISKELGSAPLESWGRFHLVWHVLAEGDAQGARRALADYTALTERLRQPGHTYNATYLSATFDLLGGDFDSFDHKHRAGLEIGRRLGEGDASLASFAAQYFGSLLLRGGLGGIEPLMLSASSQWPVNPPERWWRPLVCLEGGRIEEARERFEACADQDFEDFRFETMIGSLALATFVAEVCVRLGDARRAAILYRRLEPYKEQWVVSSFGMVCCGPISHHLAGLAATQGDFAKAAELFELATRQLETAAAPAFLPRTQVGYAAMLLARGEDGDAARAADLLHAASEAAQRLGLAPVAERIAQMSGVRS